MATTSEKQALGFLVLVALAGSAVRLAGVDRFAGEALGATTGGVDTTIGERALAAQLAAIDSARAAPRRAKSTRRTRAGDSSAAARARTPLRQPTRPARERQPDPVEVDVNRAPADELERLPRVGPALAKRIVLWREQHGPFADLDDLRHVRGIGPATVRLVAPLVTFSGRHRPIVSEDPRFAPPSHDDAV
jgi:competence protein ComEA